MKAEPGCFSVLKRYLKYCYGRILAIWLISLLSCFLIYSYGIDNDLKTVKKLVELLFDSFINLIIFLPSISFVTFGLLPSVGQNIKIKLIEKGETHSRMIEGVLDDLALVFYLSVISIGFSISIKMIWESISEEIFESLSYFQASALITLTFSLGLAFLVMILERIWMTIYLVHSILLGDFESIEIDFEQTKEMIRDGKVSPEMYDNVINGKIGNNLSASSIKNLEKKIKND